MPAKVILEVTHGSMLGKCFEYDSHNLFMLGRRSHCQASIDDDYVSRHQFVLEANPPSARLMDMNSLHGTFVNDRKYGGREEGDTSTDEMQSRPTYVDLKDGDRIRVGKTELLVRIIAPPTCEHCGLELTTAPVGGTLVAASSLVQCDACRDSQARVLNQEKLNPEGRCIQCGADIFKTIEQNESDEWDSSDSLCSSCRDSRPVGVKRLVQLARRVWKQFTVGNEWEGYEIESELGVGNMGQVYKARRIKDDRIVAIKTMLSKVAVSDDSRKMFLREIDVMRQLKHPNLVSFIESKTDRNQFFFVMEFCNEGSLESLMKKSGGKVPYKAAISMLLQCLDGIHSAHYAKIVHRDLKPANILLTSSNGKWNAKIGDLGLAKNFDRAGYSGLSMTGTAAGTPGFMPREQLTNYRESKPVSDLWSLAASFYNALTGFTPLNFPTVRDQYYIKTVFEVILNKEPVPMRQRDSTMPAGLAAVIDRALLVDRDRRYQSAAEMKIDVLKATSQLEVQKLAAKWFDDQEIRARRIDEKQSLQAVQKERESFLSTKVLPKSAPISIVRMQQVMLRRMNEAFEKAMRETKKQRNDLQASDIEKEHQLFRTTSLVVRNFVAPKVSATSEWIRNTGCEEALIEGRIPDWIVAFQPP